MEIGTGSAIQGGSSGFFIVRSSFQPWPGGEKRGTLHTRGGEIVFFFLAAYPRVQIQGLS
jgi:hypothetical protein